MTIPFVIDNQHKMANVLNDEKKQLRGDGAVFALVALGPNAERVVGELSTLVGDPATSRIVAGRAANALACIDPRFWNNDRP